MRTPCPSHPHCCEPTRAACTLVQLPQLQIVLKLLTAALGRTRRAAMSRAGHLPIALHHNNHACTASSPVHAPDASDFKNCVFSATPTGQARGCLGVNCAAAWWTSRTACLPVKTGARSARTCRPAVWWASLLCAEAGVARGRVRTHAKPLAARGQRPAQRAAFAS